MVSTARIAVLLIGAAALASGGCQLIPPPGPLTKLEAPPRLPQPTTTYLDLGRTFLRSGDPVQAQDAFIRSLRVEGMTAEALTGAGVAAEKQGLMTEAKRYFERARILAPDSVMAHNNLGAVLYRLGEYYSAKQAFQAAFALSSGTSKVATHNLALSEMAIRRAASETYREIPNPIAIQREGTGEYRLTSPAAQPEKEQS